MGQNKDKLQELSQNMINLMVSDVLKKHKVDGNSTESRISDEQKEKIREIVNGLQCQVEDFISNQGKKVTDEDVEKVEEKTEEMTTIRDRIRKKKFDK